MLGLWIGIAVISGLIFLAFIKANLRICHPNEILVFGCPLTTIPIDVELSGALCNGIIPINIQAMANVKIAGNEEEGFSNASERFLGKNIDEISRIAKENIEGSLRGVLATLTPEEANSKRLEFAERVAHEARNDLKRLGLVLDTLKIKHISDNEGYLDAIGRGKNAEVRRDAKIAEANAEAEARLVAAEAKKRGSVAEVEAKAKVAYDIARVEEEQKLEEQRVEMNKRKYEADVIIPAQAEKEAKELKAAGEAARIVEDGKATAEAVRLMRQEWEKEDTRELFLIQQLPDILDKVTRVVSDNLSIDKITIVDSGNGHGIPAYVRGVTGSIVAIFEQIKNATGLDIPGILQAKGKTTEIKREL